MRRLRLALLLLVLVAKANADDGVYCWRMRRGDDGERALANLVRETGPEATRPLALVAEISSVNEKSTARRTDIAASPALRAAKRPVIVVLRIGRTGAGFNTDVAWQTLLTGELRHALGSFGKVGIPVDEAQLDFDCPVSRLAAYADLVSGIRKQFPKLRFSVTGMPAWLDKPGLPELLDAVDSWTLQVHLTDLPKTTASLPPLCDTVKARRWITRAATYGKSFRVALPTYSYLAHFDASGKFAFVEAEAGLARMQNGSVQHWSPDFPAIAALVKEFRAQPPAHFQGFDWYRLPCDDDRLNLTPAAFAKLRRGEAPTPGKIEARATRSADGRIADLALVNSGELDAETPATLRIAYGARPSLYDLPHSRRIRESDTELVVAPPAGRLRPGESRALGWLRFTAKDTDLSLRPVSQ